MKKKIRISTIIIIIICLWLGSGVAIYYSFEKSLIGQIGDMFGAINALFSGLALAGIIYTIYLQREELKLQRKELILNRKELKRSAEAQEKSQLSIQEQADALSFTVALNTINTLINSSLMQLDPKNGFLFGETEKKIQLKKELSEYHQKLVHMKNIIEKENENFFTYKGE
ncbi:hypothetical protein [Leptospira mtsangambouensis]|uniref:hypothetical protein n=1 Tax=Leptospira mtsangambouensis TaxID=2484912 RepID=UPI001EEA9DB1|nr:hypothetical protein [Leptospira mtsangambouensis]MCG6142741.1 hypothetical protein [Leptospira mtsangambouensis]